MKFMKKLVLLCCIFLIPLTLASETQHRFKVSVRVDGGDEQAVNTIESHLKRELRLLGDVDIVRRFDDWEHIIEIYVMTIQFKNGTETGHYAISTYTATRVKEDRFKDSDTYKVYRPTFNGVLGTAHYTRNSLHEFCINLVGDFDKDTLELYRGIYKVLKR